MDRHQDASSKASLLAMHRTLSLLQQHKSSVDASCANQVLIFGYSFPMFLSRVALLSLSVAPRHCGLH